MKVKDDLSAVVEKVLRSLGGPESRTRGCIKKKTNPWLPNLGKER